jgi:hypothetical protein
MNPVGHHGTGANAKGANAQKASTLVLSVFTRSPTLAGAS